MLVFYGFGDYNKRLIAMFNLQIVSDTKNII